MLPNVPEFKTARQLGSYQHLVIKLHCLNRQNFVCPIVGTIITFTDHLHHTLIYRSDIQGWKDLRRRALVLGEPLNCLVLSPIGHGLLEGDKKKGWNLLKAYYSEADLYLWYRRMAQYFRGGLPVDPEYFINN